MTWGPPVTVRYSLTCGVAGCRNRALQGRYHCAAHAENADVIAFCPTSSVFDVAMRLDYFFRRYFVRA